MAVWEKKNLFELGELQRGRSRHRPRNDESLYGGEYPFVQTGDVKSANFYVTKHEQTYNEKGLAQSKLWSAGTLCITIAANIAESAVLKYPACFPDSVLGFIADNTKSDVKFVKYALDHAKTLFQNNSKGATQDNLSLGKIEHLKFPVPAVEIQREVGAFINHYDELIESNSDKIFVLDEMAQRLYIEWFVNFKFPGHESVNMVDSGTKLGKIPEGWAATSVGKEITVRKGKNITKSTISAGTIPVVAGGLEPAYYHNKSNTKAPVITVSASGANAGFVNLYLRDIWSSDSSYIDATTTNFVFFYYLLFKSRQDEINRMRHGSAQPHVYPKDLERLQFVIPSTQILERAEETFKGIFSLKQNLQQQNDLLTSMRDMLIPQLVTGKRELKDV